MLSLPCSGFLSQKTAPSNHLDNLVTEESGWTPLSQPPLYSIHPKYLSNDFISLHNPQYPSQSNHLITQTTEQPPNCFLALYELFFPSVATTFDYVILLLKTLQ